MTNNDALIKYLNNYFRNNPEIFLCFDPEHKIYLQGPRDDYAALVYNVPRYTTNLEQQVGFVIFSIDPFKAMVMLPKQEWCTRKEKLCFSYLDHEQYPYVDKAKDIYFDNIYSFLEYMKKLNKLTTEHIFFDANGEYKQYGAQFVVDLPVLKTILKSTPKEIMSYMIQDSIVQKLEYIL